MRHARVVIPALLLSLSCSQLNFLKPASVPRPKGRSSLERGPAPSPAVSAVPDTVGDWLTYNRNLSGDRRSPLAEIDAANVAELQPTCTFDLGERAAFQAG